MIISHDNEAYRKKWNTLGLGRYNGAFYYSKEIVKNIIPNVDTDRNWVTIRVPDCVDHSIVFIHNNVDMRLYDYLKDYNDLILVCGVRETVSKVHKHTGHKAIYLPLSVDVEYVKQFIRPKTKDTAYVGRYEKTKYMNLPKGIDYIHGLKRQDMLPLVAEYKNIYAVGRTAIEAKILNCKIINADERYLHKRWRILDNKEAAVILQRELDRIDGQNTKNSINK